jgi:anaerobic C4-dicarboxylate transporter
VTAIATDETGTTGITKYAIWHSFSLPMFVMWISSNIVALGVAALVYGTS